MEARRYDLPGLARTNRPVIFIQHLQASLFHADMVAIMALALAGVTYQFSKPVPVPDFRIEHRFDARSLIGVQRLRSANDAARGVSLQPRLLGQPCQQPCHRSIAIEKCWPK